MLTTCPCGHAPTLQLSENRRMKREAAMESYEKAAASPHSGGAGRKEYELAAQALMALDADVLEVRCLACGRFVWHPGSLEDPRSVALTENRWNRAVEKLGTLEACCQASEDRRVDHDGMVIVKCNDCGRRHFPLEPDA